MSQKKQQRQVGVWIDHREAVLVFAAEEYSEITRISSNVEKQLRRVDPSTTNRRNAALSFRPADVQDRAFTGHLLRYYDQVIAHIRPGDKILILGPGEAKTELMKRLHEKGFGQQIVRCVPADKLSPRKLEETVRGHFFPVVVNPTATVTQFRQHSH